MVQSMTQPSQAHLRGYWTAKKAPAKMHLHVQLILGQCVHPTYRWCSPLTPPTRCSLTTTLTCCWCAGWGRRRWRLWPRDWGAARRRRSGCGSRSGRSWWCKAAAAAQAGLSSSPLAARWAAAARHTCPGSTHQPCVACSSAYTWYRNALPVHNAACLLCREQRTSYLGDLDESPIYRAEQVVIHTCLLDGHEGREALLMRKLTHEVAAYVRAQLEVRGCM